MKFYSEKLDEMFNTPEELLHAEETTTKKKKRKLENTTKCEATSEESQPTRKQLAAAVETADEAVKAAYVDYETAKAKVEELSKQYLEQVEAILDPAKKAITAAEQRRYQAIKKFNETFGAYQVTYTGTKAADELFKALTSLNTRTNRLFTDLFRF